ncbi:hypothetical protein CPB83DRAFT_896609 [Crepidotus variabilis]|uniref:DUF6699 domain-containing protein n=1 Tax=Crepidotus variabilis TaxID=179855 RepID=A0A9P6JM74_9AGAR|nr:hypothetical protein CPB83DRAFT_896609 [Crepidotus variabilis]
MDSPTRSRSKTVRFDPHDTQYTYEREPSSSPQLSDGQLEVEVDTLNSHSPPNWVISSTPSPTHSVSTIDTDGPQTPLSAGPSNLFYTSLEAKDGPLRRGSPPKYNGRVWLHPVIATAPIPWDVCDRPSAVIADIKIYGHEDGVIRNPSQSPYFNIIHPRLPSWPLRIDLRKGGLLTLESLYTILFNYLNEPLKNVDLSQQSKGKAIYDAFVKRCKARGLDPRQDAIRRIDFTCGQRIFYGLREVEEDPMSYELVLLPEAVS